LHERFRFIQLAREGSSAASVRPASRAPADNVYERRREAERGVVSYQAAYPCGNSKGVYFTIGDAKSNETPFRPSHLNLSCLLCGHLPHICIKV
jgi:hypothetical protein